MLERRWHVHRLLKKLLDGRAVDRRARGHTFAILQRPFVVPKLQLLSSLSDALCARCVWWTRKSLPIVCRASRVLIENVKATEKTFVSPECADRKNTIGGARGKERGRGRECARVIGLRRVFHAFRNPREGRGGWREYRSISQNDPESRGLALSRCLSPLAFVTSPPPNELPLFEAVVSERRPGNPRRVHHYRVKIKAKDTEGRAFPARLISFAARKAWASLRRVFGKLERKRLADSGAIIYQ